MKKSDGRAITRREVRKQFKALQQINQEIVGWITMDDTQINYPIVQAKDNDYYLFRNYKGKI